MCTAASSEVQKPPAVRLLLLVLAAAIYFGGPALLRPGRSWEGHFPRLADAFLHGRLDLRPEPPMGIRLDELIQAEGGSRLYCPYPPLPAILLMPFVLAFGSFVTVEAATRAVSIANLILFDACLLRLPGVLGLPRLESRGRVMLNLLFGFGTVSLHNAWLGGDWHLAHAVTLCAMLFALLEYSRARRPWLLGIYAAAVILTRPTAGLACVFFAMPFLRSRRAGDLLRLLAPPLLSAGLLAVYNLARFGDALDFGYQRMYLTGSGKLAMDTYGQFHPHFIVGNLFWFFLAPPWPTAAGHFPWLGYDPRGLSLLLSCPPVIYVFVALKRRWEQAAVRDSLLAVLLALIPLLLYFNSGYWQFGHRFCLDYMAPLMVLVVAGIGTRPGPGAFTLATVAIVIQFWGVSLAPVTRLPIN